MGRTPKGAKWARWLLWRLAHLVFVVSQAVDRFARRFRRRKGERVEGKSRRCDHLALVLDGASPSVDSLAKVVAWSLAADVKHLTFYDSEGLLKKREDELIAAVERSKPAVAGEVKWACRSETNGRRRKIVVRVFSAEHGKSKIVSCMRTEEFRNLNPDELTVERFDAILNRHYSYVPEPNLIVYFGDACYSRGFLPWHVRLTEFLGLDSENLSLESFEDVLRRYEKCEQRYGK